LTFPSLVPSFLPSFISSFPPSLLPAELYDGVAIEAQAREEEDCLVLDSMLESQKALQRIILENYGGGRGAVGGGGVGVGGGSFFLRLESCGEGKRSHEEDEEGVEEWER